MVNLVKLLSPRDRIEFEWRSGSSAIEWLFGHEITEGSQNIQHNRMIVAIQSLAITNPRDPPGFLYGDQEVTKGCIVSKGQLGKRLLHDDY